MNNNILVSDRIGIWEVAENSETSPGTTSFGSAIRLKFSIDTLKLEESIKKLIRDYDVFRMVFKKTEDKLYVDVFDEIEFKLPVIEFEGDEEEKINLVYEDCQKRFDSRYNIFEPGGCSKFALYKIGESDNVLFVSMTHVVTDGTTLALTVYNIISYYLRDQPIGKIESSFLDCLKEENEYLSSELYQKQEKYWKEVMKGFTKSEIIPIGKAEYSKEKSGCYFEITKKGIPEIADKYKSSIFNILLLAYHLTFYSVNDSNDNLIKYADSNRSMKNKLTLGFLAIFIPNRVKINKNIPISELIHKVTDQSRKDYTYRKAGCKYVDTTDGCIFSYLSNDTNSDETENFMNKFAADSNLEMINLKSGKDSDMVIMVINKMKDRFIIELSASSRIYGQDFVEKFKNEYIRIVDAIKNELYVNVSDLLELDDEIEEI